MFITYDEKVVEKERQFKNLFQNRVLSIDLNMNCFGISIIEFDRNDDFKVIHKEVVDVSELQSKSANKIKFELYEIARRAYRTFQKGQIYPSYEISFLGNRWKEELELRYMSWKGLAGIVKESKLKYRFPLQPSKAVFSKTYMNSCTTVYNYS